MSHLQTVLSTFGIDWNAWTQKKGNKTLYHLLREIERGESSLLIYCASLRRVYKRVVGNIYCFRSGKLFWLQEKKQKFKGGGCRKRIRRISVGEKMYAKESPHSAMRRCLWEELGLLNQSVKVYPTESVQEKEKQSKSRPGLVNLFSEYRYSICVSSQHWKRRGYLENQWDKTTFFVWKRIPMSKRFLSVYVQIRKIQRMRIHHVFCSKKAVQNMRKWCAYTIRF